MIRLEKKNLTYLYNNMHLLVCILYFKRIFPWIVQKSPIKPLMLLSRHFFLCISGISWRLLNTVVRTLLGKHSSYAEISGLGPHSAPYSSFDMHLGSSPRRLGMSRRFLRKEAAARTQASWSQGWSRESNSRQAPSLPGQCPFSASGASPSMSLST